MVVLDVQIRMMKIRRCYLQTERGEDKTLSKNHTLNDLFFIKLAINMKLKYSAIMETNIIMSVYF